MQIAENSSTHLDLIQIAERISHIQWPILMKILRGRRRFATHGGEVNPRSRQDVSGLAVGAAVETAGEVARWVYGACLSRFRWRSRRERLIDRC